MAFNFLTKRIAAFLTLLVLAGFSTISQAELSVDEITAKTAELNKQTPLVISEDLTILQYKFDPASKIFSTTYKSLGTVKWNGESEMAFGQILNLEVCSDPFKRSLLENNIKVESVFSDAVSSKTFEAFLQACEGVNVRDTKAIEKAFSAQMDTFVKEAKKRLPLKIRGIRIS